MARVAGVGTDSFTRPSLHRKAVELLDLEAQRLELGLHITCGFDEVDSQTPQDTIRNPENP